jgi:hypothetical protein
VTHKTGLRGLGVLGLASGSVVAGEVLLTRLLSVCTWYGLAFLVLSIAMLGTTQGALAAARARTEGKPLEPWIAGRMVALSLGLVLTALVSVSVPLVFYPDVTSLASVVVVVAAATVPMAAGGSVAARLMAELPVPVSTAYAVDLACAALGALAPLALLGPLTGPSALIAIGAVAAAAAYLIDRRASAGYAFGLCAALVLVTELTGHGVVVRYPKGHPRVEEPLAFESWNPLSYVAVSSFAMRAFSVWSPGLDFHPHDHLQAAALIDGEAGTFVYAYPGAKHVDRLDQLREDGTAIAHVIRPEGTSCVMGVGGGRDLETALLAGHDRVQGFEINPAMVAMLHHVHDKSPILDDPRVTVTVGDARTELARSDVRCRVLQASLVDTWAATSAGAFAHTEATLYTLEGWSLFLKRVEPDGVLTFSRWYEPSKPSETSRLVALAVGALHERGVARPRDHIALIAGGLVATILVSPSPLSEGDITKLKAAIAERGFTPLVLPGEPSSGELLDELLDAPDVAALAAAGEPEGLDTSPPSDDRPFFFQLLAPRAWLHPVAVLRRFYGDRRGMLAGNVAAALELVLAALASILVAAALLGPTLLRAARDRDFALPGRASAVYFASLGAGFMLTEVALVQRLHVVLGHPTYALVVVLAGLLVATGVGSALSPRVVRSRRAVTAAASTAAVMLAAVSFVVGRVAHATLEAPFALRIAWCGACAASLGVVLGMLFPSGLAFTDRERAAPVALALNGATSVVGGALAVALSVSLGIPATFVTAAAFYALAAACGPSRWRPVDAAP